MSNYRILPIGGGGIPSSLKYGASIEMSMDSDFILSVQLKDQDGNALGALQTVDLPLESVVVSGSYDSQNEQLILTLENGNTIEIPISSLISGLQPTIDAQHPLDADYIVDGQVNKVINVKPDWNAAAGTAAEILNKPTIPTVNDATITIQQDGQTVDTFSLNQSADKTINLQGGGSKQWYGTQAEFDALATKDADTDYFISDKIDYNTDLKNTPNLNSYATKSEVNTKNTEQDAAIAGKMAAQFMTQQEFDNLQTKKEGDNYFIEGSTIEMVVTFTDQTTATYNVVVD